MQNQQECVRPAKLHSALTWMCDGCPLSCSHTKTQAYYLPRRCEASLLTLCFVYSGSNYVSCHYILQPPPLHCTAVIDSWHQSVSEVKRKQAEYHTHPAVRPVQLTLTGTPPPHALQLSCFHPFSSSIVICAASVYPTAKLNWGWGGDSSMRSLL